MPNSATEQLTANFYLWERRGRVWDVWDTPVELEPPFEPFFHSYPATHMIDDGRRPTILSSIADSVKKLFVKSDLEEDESVVAGSPDEPTPPPFECDLDIKEFSISLPKDQKVTPEYAEELLLNLGSCSWPLSFEIAERQGAISVQFACRETDASLVREHLRAYYSDAALKEGTGLHDLLKEDSRETAIIDCGLDQEFIRPSGLWLGTRHRNFGPSERVGRVH